MDRGANGILGYDDECPEKRQQQELVHPVSAEGKDLHPFVPDHGQEGC